MISVVIPAYNAADFIAETLDSILAQTVQDFEIIVVDDGSTDNTVQVVREYAARDARIRLIQNNHGRQSQARNTAIAVAQYPWIAPIDADDLIVPTRFEKQLDAARKKPDVVAWASYGMLITADGRPYRERQGRPQTVEEFKAMMQNGELIAVPNSSCLLRKDVVQAVGGYDSRFDGLEDVEILIRMAQRGAVLVLPESLMQYRMHYDSTTGAFESFTHQRKMFVFLEERNQKRLQGADLTLDAFLRDFEAVPFWKKALRTLDNHAAFQLKMAALYYGEKQYLNLFGAMLLSLVLNPYYVTHRILNRFVLRRNMVNYRV